MRTQVFGVLEPTVLFHVPLCMGTFLAFSLWLIPLLIKTKVERLILFETCPVLSLWSHLLPGVVLNLSLVASVSCWHLVCTPFISSRVDYTVWCVHMSGLPATLLSGPQPYWFGRVPLVKGRAPEQPAGRLSDGWLDG